MVNPAVTIMPTDIRVVAPSIATIEETIPMNTPTGTVTQQPAVSEEEGVMVDSMIRHDWRIQTFDSQIRGHR